MDALVFTVYTVVCLQIKTCFFHPNVLFLLLTEATGYHSEPKMLSTSGGVDIFALLSFLAFSFSLVSII